MKHNASMIGSLIDTADCLICPNCCNFNTSIINMACVKLHTVYYSSLTAPLQEILSNKNIFTVNEKSEGKAKTDYAIIKSTKC